MTKKVSVIVEGCTYVVEVGNLDERPIKATVNNRTYEVEVPEGDPVDEPIVGREAQEVHCAAITAPMPGDILEVRVTSGQRVQPGEVVCVLEAMKMRNLIRTSQSGVIATVEVNAGQSVDYGTTLVTFE